MSQLRTPGPGRPSRRHGARFGRSVVPTVVASAAVLVLAACSGSSTPTGTSSAGAPTSAAGDASAEPSPSSSTFPCAADATPVTFWGWSAGYDLAVNEFNATHPEICVTIENAGAAGDEYTKLSDALKAGTGAPDVAQIEYFELPSFTITDSLENLSQYGVGDAEANEVPAAWGQVTQGDAIYAMPVDVGPMALWYNKDQLDAEAQRRMHTNPLRILDTKNPAMQALVEGAPRLMDHLGAESRAHFDAVRAVAGVVDLHAGALGEAVTLLPGRRVPGLRVAEDHVDVHVAMAHGVDVRAVAAQVRDAVAAVRPGPVTVVVEDVVEDDLHDETPADRPAVTDTPVLPSSTERSPS